MMATPAIRGEDLLARQQADQARLLGASPEDVARERMAYGRVVAALRANAAPDELREHVRKLVETQYEARSTQARLSLGDMNAVVEKAVPAALRQMQTPAVRDLIDLDPTSLFESISCPTLALLGGKDTQVPLDLNRLALESAFAGGDATRLTLKVYPEANHLFIAAHTGQVIEYQTLPKQFVAGFLDDMTQWVLAQPPRHH
jgi:fermentation-respiration switch protein FrsA (DUF1100 family)